MSFHQLHHNEISTLHLAHFVDCAYVRIIQGRRRLCLAQQQVLHFCADASSRTSSFAFHSSFVVRDLSPMPRWQPDIHWLLLNLHSGVRGELLLAFDASLTYRSEFRRVPDFVE